MTHAKLRELKFGDLVQYQDYHSAGAGARTIDSLDGVVVDVDEDCCAVRWEDGGNSTLYYDDLADTRVAKIVRRVA